jgi:hypothetical protein
MAIMDLAEGTKQMCSPYTVKPMEVPGSFDFYMKKVPQSLYGERAGVVLLELLRKQHCEKRS